MRQYKEVERTTKVKELVALRCDICGAVAKRDGWVSGIYEINETEVEVKVFAREGQNYPEGGYAETKSFDICPVCFKDKLAPFIESLGAKMHSEETDW